MTAGGSTQMKKTEGSLSPAYGRQQEQGKIRKVSNDKLPVPEEYGQATRNFKIPVKGMGLLFSRCIATQEKKSYRNGGQEIVCAEREGLGDLRICGFAVDAFLRRISEKAVAAFSKALLCIDRDARQAFNAPFNRAGGEQHKNHRGKYKEVSPVSRGNI